MRYLFTLSVFFLLGSSIQQSASCFAQAPPSPIPILQQHEQHLRNFMFDWQLTQSVVFIGSSQQSEAIVMSQDRR